MLRKKIRWAEDPFHATSFFAAFSLGTVLRSSAPRKNETLTSVPNFKKKTHHAQRHWVYGRKQWSPAGNSEVDRSSKAFHVLYIKDNYIIITRRKRTLYTVLRSYCLLLNNCNIDWPISKMWFCVRLLRLNWFHCRLITHIWFEFRWLVSLVWCMARWNNFKKYWRWFRPINYSNPKNFTHFQNHWRRLSAFS